MNTFYVSVEILYFHMKRKISRFTVSSAQHEWAAADGGYFLQLVMTLRLSHIIALFCVVKENNTFSLLTITEVS